MMHTTTHKLSIVESPSENVNDIKNQSGAIIFTDNGSMYYDSVTSIRHRIDNGRNIATPQSFGAKADWDNSIPPWGLKYGDTSTDDSDAFQAAVDSGNSVYVPEGNYKLNNPITITKDNTHITIDGTIATSAYNGFIIRASNVTIDGNGTILFYGKKYDTDESIRGSAIVIESGTSSEGTAINIYGTTITVNIKRIIRYTMYDYVYYDKYNNSTYYSKDYDCIAIQIRSVNTNATTAGIWPVTINSTISNFRTGISIRNSDLRVKLTEDKYVENWCNGLEFNGTFEYCLCTIDNERATGSHIHGSAQPYWVSNSKRNKYDTVPLIRIYSYTFIDMHLWDLHTMPNTVGLECTGIGNIIGCMELSPKRLNIAKPGHNTILDTYSKVQSEMLLSSSYNTSQLRQCDNILQNAIYSSNIHCSYDDTNYNDTWTWGWTPKNFNYMWLDTPSDTAICRAANNGDLLDVKVTIRFDTPVSMKAFAVCGEILPDEIKFVFYSKNKDSSGNALTAEMTQHANIKNEDGIVWGNWDKNKRGILSYAIWQWQWDLVSQNKLMWGSGWNDATISGVDIHFISYETDNVATQTTIAKITSIYAMTGEPTYICKNGGTVKGELKVPTPSTSSDSNVVANKSYVDNEITKLKNTITELQTKLNNLSQQ